MKKRLPFIVAAVIATLFIFNNSLQSAAVSTESSGRIVAFVSYILGFFGVAPDRAWLVGFVRKSAHIAEFTLQAILLASCFEMQYKRRIIYIFFLGLLTACVDEYIQIFSPGRAGMVADIFVDFAGTALGAAIAGISYRLRRK